jgi:8-oxo-dGTP diphosphatase
MTVVRAAGGVVVRREGGDWEVLLVHRPRYDDWTLPKGKLEPGETEAEGALREVEEETGLRCELGPELAKTSYTDSRGRPKTVRYWEMYPREGSFTPHHEVDDARWLPLDEARRLLSYDRDRTVLDRLLT